METIKEKVYKMLNGIKAQCEQQESKLKEDERADEALIEKIRANIADIFLTVFNVSYRQTAAAKGDAAMLIDKFNEFFVKLPSPWKESLTEAKENDDFETIYKEEAKIAMAERIQREFEKIAQSEGK